MRIFPVLAALSAAFSISGFALPAAPDSLPPVEKQEAREIESALAAWVEMWNSYDLDAVERLFDTEGEVTYFSSEREGLIIGIEALKEHHKGFGFVPGGKQQPNRLWVDEVYIAQYGDAWLAAGIWFFSREGVSAEQAQRGPFSALYIMRSGGFRITHMHFASYD